MCYFGVGYKYPQKMTSFQSGGPYTGKRQKCEGKQILILILCKRDQYLGTGE